MLGIGSIIPFVMNAFPAPAIASISPTSVVAGSGNTALTVNGSDFTSSGVVRANGVDLATTYVSPTQLTATVPSSFFSAPGSVAITVNDAGGLSNSVNLTVSHAQPVISSLSPNSIVQGSGNTNVTVTGQWFTNAAQARVDGSNVPTTFVSSTQLTIVVPSANLLTTGTRVITVVDAGGTSAGSNLTVTAAQPVISSLSPSSATAGSGNTNLTVNGQWFDALDNVALNGSVQGTMVLSPTQMLSTIPSAMLTSPGSISVQVVGTGRASNTATFTVNNAAPTISSLSLTSRAQYTGSFTLTINGANFTNAAQPRFNGVNMATTFVSSTQITAVVTLNMLANAGTFAVTVVDAGGTSGGSNFTVTAYNPLSVTGLVEFRCDVGVSVVGGAVQSWQDRSGTFTASQGTASQRPSYAASGGVNNLPIINYDFTDDRLVTSALSNFVNATSWEVMVLYRPNAGSASGNAGILTDAAGMNGYFDLWATSVADLTHRIWDTAYRTASRPGTIVAGSATILEGRRDATGLYSRTNGGTESAPTANTGIGLLTGLLHIGNFARGDMYDVTLVKGSFPSVAARDQHRRYLQHFGGMTLT
jgi:hypothetical protein